LSPEEREKLKAALSDPYASGGGTAGKPLPPMMSVSAPASPPAGARPAGKGKAVTLRDRVEGAKVIAEANDLERLRYLISGCHMCGLAAGRTLAVAGDGNPRAELMFIGEGPGYHEDVQGRPFVGRAGALLTQMIQAMGLRREDVFITNIVKCRPPGNRDPEPDEIKACEPYLKRQIELIGPRLICALGRIAIQGLLRNTTPITKLRGKWQAYQGIPLMPTFHPAYLLRNPSEKRSAWEDLQAIMARLAGPK
jgi:DNA polymerase